jgi:hypothetical protein
MKSEGQMMFRDRVVLAGCVSACLLVAAGGAFLGATADELTFDLKVEHGRVADAMRLIRVKQGDVVRMRWTADRPLVLHLHGYDIEKRVEPRATTELTFTASATGRFPVHVHAQGERADGHAHEEEPLVSIEVYPR